MFYTLHPFFQEKEQEISTASALAFCMQLCPDASLIKFEETEEFEALNDQLSCEFAL